MPSHAQVKAMFPSTYDEGQYAWIITKDNVTQPGDGLPSRVGLTGPSQATEEQINLAKTIGLKWRTRCDEPLDECLPCYYGLIWTSEGNDYAELNDSHFGPLDDFATTDAGCVTIEYKNPETGQWETL